MRSSDASRRPTGAASRLTRLITETVSGDDGAGKEIHVLEVRAHEGARLSTLALAGVLAPLVLPAAWVVVAEFARTGDLANGFPWAFLGYSAHRDGPLLELAALGPSRPGACRPGFGRRPAGGRRGEVAVEGSLCRLGLLGGQQHPAAVEGEVGPRRRQGLGACEVREGARRILLLVVHERPGQPGLWIAWSRLDAGRGALEPVLGAADVIALQRQVREIHIGEKIQEYIVNLAVATREHADVRLGMSPRGSLALMRAAQAYEFLKGGTFLTPDSVKAVATSVVSHRLILDPHREYTGLSRQAIIKSILERTPVPVSPPSETATPTAQHDAKSA